MYLLLFLLFAFSFYLSAAAAADLISAECYLFTNIFFLFCFFSVFICDQRNKKEKKVRKNTFCITDLRKSNLKSYTEKANVTRMLDGNLELIKSLLKFVRRMLVVFPLVWMLMMVRFV